jgi:hypothetical protein
LLRRPADHEQYDSEQYLKNTEDRFVFDSSTGIYKPKTDHKHKESSHLHKIWDNFRKHWASIILNGLTLFFVIKYTNYARLQWQEMKRAADATKLAAEAAKSSATTADATLHITQKAYLTDGPMTADSPGSSITLPIVNGGHIPSGPVEIVVHEATFNIVPPNNLLDTRSLTEIHWGRTRSQSIPPNWPYSITIPVPKMSKGDVTSGLQTIIVAGFIAYNDGFPDTPRQRWVFCQRTTYHAVAKHLIVGPCNPGDDTLRKLELIDGYPNNAEPGSEK